MNDYAYAMLVSAVEALELWTATSTQIGAPNSACLEEVKRETERLRLVISMVAKVDEF